MTNVTKYSTALCKMNIEVQIQKHAHKTDAVVILYSTVLCEDGNNDESLGTVF